MQSKFDKFCLAVWNWIIIIGSIAFMVGIIWFGVYLAWLKYAALSKYVYGE